MEITSRMQGSQVTRFLLLVACLVLIPSVALGSVRLTTATQPPSGLAGSSNVYATGTGFPTGTIAPSGITVSFASTCLVTPLATATATQVKNILGTTDRVYFNIPSTLATGTYAVWLTDSSPAFTSSSCSALMVTNTTKTLAACIPSSSLAVSVGKTVTAYVPNGYWDGGASGVEVVNIEGGGSPTTISTGSDVINACSSNAVTGQTVCTANNKDVYLITGTTTSSPLSSGATGTAGFSGGSCENCGVAIDAADNIAVLEEGNSGASPGGSQFQALNLADNKFNTPLLLQSETSENISIDPTRNLILSPNEYGVYVLAGIGPGPGYTLSEFDSTFNTDEENDSGAEDCTTGLALSSEEFTNDVLIADLTQATFTPGSPAGTWTAPRSTLDIVSDYSFSAGTCGISVAPGSAHLGVVTGEFGGSTFAVLQLPSTSGSGTPSIADYATAQIPGGTACGGPFYSGADPHTITAYTSPNTGKAYGVFAGYNSSEGVGGIPVCVAVVDLQAILSAPRGGGGLAAHDVAAADVPAGAITYFAIP